MSIADRRHILPWLALLLIAAGSLGFAMYRLTDLPELGMTIGTELEVRSVSSPEYTTSETPKFKRGDRLVSLEGHALEDLRDLRVLLRSMPRDKKLGDGEDSAGLRYQVVRPFHRYTIALQGQRDDPTAMPPGFNPKTDRLVEIDGRPLPDRIGPEGVRSIVGSRPDSLLTFERRNAVFGGTVDFEPSDVDISAAVIFGLVLLLIGGMWRYRSRQLHRWSPIAVAAETIGFAWLALMAIAHQWLLADWVLATGTIISMIMVRPLAIFARSMATRRRGDTSGWWALGIGVGYTALVVGLLHGGVLEHAEKALYAAACGAALYLVYELFMLAFNDAPHLTLREGGGYLGGILIVGLATAFLSWNVQPVAFGEDLWRWYTIAFVALVSFGDILFCLRGPSGVGYGDVETPDERRSSIRQYLETLSDEIGHAKVMVVVQRGDASAQIALDNGGIDLTPSDDAVIDLVDILLQERSRIPLPDAADRSTNPLMGIAQTMNIVLALRLHPPSGGIALPDTEVVVLAVEESDAGELPTYASSETVEFAQRELNPSAWAAMFVEGMALLSELGAPERVVESASVVENDNQEGATEDDEQSADDIDGDGGGAERVDELESEIEAVEKELAEACETIELLREDRSELATQLDGAEQRLRRSQPPVDKREELLEQELLETIDYLLESDEPIVIGGPFGAGKEFVARCGAAIEGQPPEAFVLYDAFDDPPDDHHVALFGGHGDEPDSPGEGLVAAAAGASLLIRSAERLSDSLLMGLCNSSEEQDFRLYLSFDEPDIEDTSVLAGRPDKLVERLEHRELMLPSFHRRTAVITPILEHYLERYARLRDKRVSGFTDRALEALKMYDYPAELHEAKLLVDLAVLRTTGQEIGLAPLNLDVRRHYERKTTSPDDTNQ